MKRSQIDADLLKKFRRGKDVREVVLLAQLTDEVFADELEEEINRDPMARGNAYLQMMHSHFPDRFGAMVPEGGAWIMAKRVPLLAFPTGKSYQVPPLSLWFAQPEWMPSSKLKGLALRHKAHIMTPAGELCLEPHEYVVWKGGVQSLLQADTEGEVQINYLSDSAAVDEDALFYLRSRGIGKADALLMLIDQVKDWGFCWFQLPHAYAVFFGLDREAGEMFGTVELKDAKQNQAA